MIKKRVRTIPIRPPTQSRRSIFIIVVQLQNAKGSWLTPTITFEGPVNLVLESGRYARDVGIALIVAAFYYDQMMADVNGSAKTLEQEEQEEHDDLEG